MKLKDKVVIVTGGAFGIGKAIALRMGREGGKVVVCGYSHAPELVVKEIEYAGGEAMALRIDVSIEEQTLEMAKKAFDRFGHIDILVNNAGVFGGLKKNPVEDTPTDVWDRVMGVNVKGTFFCCKAVVPYMKKQKKGKIINIGSTVAFNGLPNLLHYTTSKGGIVSMTRALARELGEFNIAVNNVSPGMTYDEAIKTNIPEEVIQRNLNTQCIKRLVYPEDVAAMVAFLASDDCDLVTGQVIAVNGGETLH
jgi:NAD(P)-dependent dehydrogenase (short-subunit alcohol dehydrogenase family)